MEDDDQPGGDDLPDRPHGDHQEPRRIDRDRLTDEHREEPEPGAY